MRIPYLYLPLLTLLLVVSCKEKPDAEKAAMIPGAEIYLQVERVAASKTKTANDIQPYDDALAWHEYKVLKVLKGKIPKPPPIIRVAHWTVAAGKDLPVNATLGQKEILSLTRFDKVEDLDEVPKSDDLDPLETPPRYIALLPEDKTVPPPDALRYDYRGQFSKQMRMYWKLRPQLELVVMGNSHATKSISTREFLNPKNLETPVAFNLSPAGSNNEMQCLIVKEYVQNLPNLKYVVWLVSARNYNETRQEAKKLKDFTTSPGWRHDQANKAELWPVKPAEKLLTVHDYAEETDAYDDWGWNGQNRRVVPDEENAKAFEKYIKNNVEAAEFVWSDSKWQALADEVKKLTDRGVKVLLVTTPMHPVFADMPHTDPNGTTNEGQKIFVEKGRALEASSPLIYFYDFNEGEGHDFKADEFYDLDHLNRKGAPRFTEKIINYMKTSGML